MIESTNEGAATAEMAPRSAPARRLLTTSSVAAVDIAQKCGNDCYSYYFVQRAFAPLLRRWGELREVEGSDEALRQSAQAGDEPQPALHLSFLPLQYAPLAAGLPNVIFPFWEFPDIPQDDVGGNPRNNWSRMASQVQGLLTACEFTRDAFLKAGVQTPLSVVPVPVGPGYFAISPARPDGRASLPYPCHIADGREMTDSRAEPGRPAEPPKMIFWKERVRGWYRHRVRPLVPERLHRYLAHAGHQALGHEWPATEPPLPPLPCRAVDRLELTEVVFTSIFNPFDLRKDWQTMLTGFLRALGDCPDATLVLKLAVSRPLVRAALEQIFNLCREVRPGHRCRVAAITAFLSDQQMIELTAASTFYLNTSRAEGACLPLQDFMAAGRPGIAPAHTAMAEYLDSQVGLVVESHAETTHWPWDPDQRPTTTWRRLDAGSLESQLRRSYWMARNDRAGYQMLAKAARARMDDWASERQVWPRLNEALDAAMERAETSSATRQSENPSFKR